MSAGFYSFGMLKRVKFCVCMVVLNAGDLFKAIGMSSDSKKEIKNFYEALGAQGLANLLSPARHAAYVEFLKKVLPAQGTILDCACGYGRLTIPLAQAGYKLYGIDFSQKFIEKARAYGVQQNLSIPFLVGDMCELPFTEALFDVVICMWSSFSELLTVDDQVKALAQMGRVVKPSGFVLIDMPCPPDGEPLSDYERVNYALLGGHEHVAFIHDEQSLGELMRACGFTQFSFEYVDIGGIGRFIFRYIPK